MTNLLAREWLNAGLIPLNACIIVIISYTLIQAYRNPPEGMSWTSAPGIKSACAFWWVFFADFIRAGMAWAFLNAQNEGRELEALTALSAVIYLVAGIIAALATFRLVYALSPDSWGHRGWIAAAATTGVFAIVLGLFA